MSRRKYVSTKTLGYISWKRGIVNYDLYYCLTQWKESSNRVQVLLMPGSRRQNNNGRAALGDAEHGGGRVPGSGQLPARHCVRRVARAAGGAAQPLRHLHAAAGVLVPPLPAAQLAQ